MVEMNTIHRYKELRWIGSLKIAGLFDSNGIRLGEINIPKDSRSVFYDETPWRREGLRMLSEQSDRFVSDFLYRRD